MKDGIAIEKFDLLFDKKSTILELDGFDLDDPRWFSVTRFDYNGA